jgi:flagellin
MTYSVNTNLGAMAALQNLSQSQRELGQTQNRVNTGLLVASTKDDSATYVVAQKLRGNVADYGIVQRSITNAKSVVDTAIAAAETINEELTLLRSKALEARDVARSDDDKITIQHDIQQAWEHIRTAINSAEFNGVNLLKGGNVSALTSIKTLADAAKVEGVTTFNGLTHQTTGSIAVSGNFAYTISTPTNTGAASSTAAATGTGTTVEAMLSNFLTATAPGTTNAIGSLARTVRNDGKADDGVTAQTGAATAATSTTAAAGGSSNAAVTLDYFDQAVKQFGNVVAKLGAVARRFDLQLTFVSKLTDSLNSGVGNLVDADLAKESTKLQALQVKQQLGIQALSIANQQPQVLQQLFRS